MKTAGAIVIIALGLVLTAILAYYSTIPGEAFLGIIGPAVGAAVSYAFKQREVKELQRELRRRNKNQQ